MSSHARQPKLTTADEAVALIEEGQTVAFSGFVGAAHPEGLSSAIERRFLATGKPRDLTIVYGAGQGDGKTRGLNHLAHLGLLRRVIGGHWGLCPSLGRMAINDEIEAYNFPQGVICQLLRDIAAGRPGTITHVGLDTFIDPARDGGRLNRITPPGAVERIELDGRPWLWFKAFPIHVGLIRATAADPRGNLTMDREAVIGEVLPIAQAAKNHGGIVIAQVEEIRNEPADPHLVRVPGVLVDRIVVASEGEHDQTFAEADNPAYYEPFRGDVSQLVHDRLSPEVRRIIGSRACDELHAGDVANLGIGLPEAVAKVAAERGLLDEVTLTVESGPIGGMPVGGLSFGASQHPDAIVDQPSQFDWYDGGGLDFSALGAAQVDERGNVNVSKFGTRLSGVGGFVNISQNSRRLVFCTPLTVDGLEVACDDGRLRIVQEGLMPKFIRQVEHLSFGADFARRLGREVLYVTERAVFRLIDEGLDLIEIAPGIDLERDVLARMEFRPLIRNVRPMDSRHFRH
ncbi:MAG: acyl CoA:acetate/3-ketoacid CoA transferase [Planctomycetaceae bacterium]|nr:acyl CoA:acetate/3-ketoacid CoA transferase [Planctomycetaceae bacterium]